MSGTITNRRLLSRLWQYARRQRRGVAILAMLMVAEALVQTATPWPMKLLVDHILSAEPMPPWAAAVVARLPGAADASSQIVWVVVASVLLFIIAASLGLVQAVAGVGIGQQMAYGLAADLFAKLQRLPLGFHARRGVGDSMRRVTADCASITTIIRDAALPATASVFTIVAMFGVMLWMNPLLALISAGAIVALVPIVRHCTPPVLDRGYAYAEAESRVWDVGERTLSAVPVIQAFTAERTAEARVAREYQAVLGTAVALTHAQFRLKIFSGILTAAGAGAIMGVGAFEVIAGRLTIGGLLVFLMYLAALYAPVDAMIHAASSAIEAAGGAKRVIEVLDEPEEVADAPGARPLDLGGKAPSLSFQAVSVGYESGRPALRDVSLEIPAGATVAIVGSSGAGKTTLANLVPRLFDPWQGRVAIAGRDVRSLTMRSLREHIAMVHQETFLFPTTIAENLSYGRPGATREQIEAAARAAGAHAFIADLPSGYDTVVGQRGSTLSGGERQRVAIARALLMDAPILILDEPTSSLDTRTETGLLDALEHLRLNRTTLLIAHRLSTVRRADLIVVLSQGRVIETGTHEHLLRHGGAYAALHALHVRSHNAETPP